MEDVAFRIDCVARFSRLLPWTPQQLNSKRFQARALRLYVGHFEDEFHGVFFSWGWRRSDLDVLRDFGRYRMQRKTRTASFEDSPGISPVMIGRRGAEHLAIEALHACQIFYIEYRAA